MTNEEFLKQFENASLEEFHHIDHIRIAWLYLRQFGFERGSQKIVEGVKYFAAAHNQSQRYHETITQFWIRAVEHCIQANRTINNFNEFIDTFPFLKETASIYKHYTKQQLMSEIARAQWVDPDLAVSDYIRPVFAKLPLQKA